MAKRGKDAEAGFQIPIEDGAAKPEDAASAAGAETRVDAEAEGEAAAGAESGEDVREGAAAEGADGAAADGATGADETNGTNGATGVDGADGAAADGAAADGATGADGAAADGAAAEGTDGTNGAGTPEDIVAEAEKVVAAAAEGLSGEDAAAQARAEASEWQDRYLRLHAEWDTYRRRMGEQRAEERARATEKLMEDLLPVLDDFERTVAYAEENGETGLLDGVKAVQAKLVGSLTKGGLEVIDPAGEPYNALEAQAVATVPDEEAYDETVRDVYQKGYKMGKKVLRPAMVTISTGGPERPKDDTE